jgi:hypothetical protein
MSRSTSTTYHRLPTIDDTATGMPVGMALRHVRRALMTLILGAVMIPAILSAQTDPLDPATAGTTYLLAFPDTVRNVFAPNFKPTLHDTLALMLYSDVPDQVTITGPGYSKSVTLAPGRFEIVYINDSANRAPAQFVDVAGVAVPTVFKVEAATRIVLYCYMVTPYGGEAWTPLPVERWGTRYNAVSVAGDYVRSVNGTGVTAIPYNTVAAPAEAVIIAASDNTSITIRPGNGQKLTTGTTTQSVTLNRGEAYMVQSVVDTNAGVDQFTIAGMAITSDKPIGVLSGNSRALVRQDNQGLLMNVYKNMLMEWLAPEDQHGTRFTFLPSWDLHTPELGSQSERSAEWAATYGTSTPGFNSHTPYFWLQQGGTIQMRDEVGQDTFDIHEYADPTATYFQSGDPTQMYMVSTSILYRAPDVPCARGIPCLNIAAWGPYMVEMVPYEQWGSFAPYYAPSYPRNTFHYINVVTDTAWAGSIYREDGTPFPFTRRVAGTPFIWGSDSVVSGVTHYLVGRNGARFSGHVYGERAGFERYRPGGSPGTGSHAELDEEIAFSYGYPLAPRRETLKFLGVDEKDAFPGALTLRLLSIGREGAELGYAMPASGDATLEIYNVLGERVAMLARGYQEEGTHRARWDGSGMASGTYYARLAAGGRVLSVPVLLER